MKNVELLAEWMWQTMLDATAKDSNLGNIVEFKAFAETRGPARLRVLAVAKALLEQPPQVLLDACECRPVIIDALPPQGN